MSARSHDRPEHIGTILQRVLGNLICIYCGTPALKARQIIPIEHEGLSVVSCGGCGLPHDVPALLPPRYDSEPEPVASCDR